MARFLAQDAIVYGESEIFVFVSVRSTRHRFYHDASPENEHSMRDSTSTTTRGEHGA